MAITTQYITGVCAQSANFDVRMECICESNATAWTTTVEYRFQIYIKQSEATDFKFDGGEGFYFYNADTYEQIGNRWYFSVYTQTYQPGAWHTISRTTRTYSHNTDGTLPPICVGGTMSDKKTNTGFGFHKNQGSITFDTLIRKATITSAPDFKDTDNPTIKYSNLMGDYVDSLQVCIADSTGYTIFVPYRDVPKTGTSYTFQLTSKERQTLIDAVKSGVSVGIRFYIKTEIYGGAHRYSVSKTFSLSDIMPDLAPAVVDMNDATIALTGDMNVLVKYHSTAACSSNGTTKQGATIKSQKVVNGSVVREKADGVFAIDNVESGKFEFSITDSRNNTTTAVVEKTLIEYVRLTCNQSVEMELTGEQTARAKITITGQYFNDTFGAVRNSLVLDIRYGIKGDEMGPWLTEIFDEGFISPTFDDDNQYSADININELEYDKTYVFECKAIDQLETVISEPYTIKLLPVFDWSEDDFNFNVPVSFSNGMEFEGDLEVEGNVVIQGDTVNDFVIETGTASMGSNGTWYWSKWKSGKAECYGVRNFGNMAVSTTWGSLYRSDSFNQDLPSGLFDAIPAVINIEYRGSNYGGWIARHEATAASETNSGGFIVVRPASATLSQAHIGFHVIGRWK